MTLFRTLSAIFVFLVLPSARQRGERLTLAGVVEENLPLGLLSHVVVVLVDLHQLHVVSVKEPINCVDHPHERVAQIVEEVRTAGFEYGGPQLDVQLHAFESMVSIYEYAVHTVRREVTHHVLAEPLVQPELVPKLPLHTQYRLSPRRRTVPLMHLLQLCAHHIALVVPTHERVDCVVFHNTGNVVQQGVRELSPR